MTSTTFAERHPLDRPPIDEIWTRAAARLGFVVERTGEAYASTDGQGRILIGAPETLDADDSVAQLVFHELCHALVQGEGNLRVPDWGLDNTDDRHLPAEHACLRLQAHLADGHALRALMIPTTISAGYYRELAPFPLDGRDQAASLAQDAVRTMERWGWRPVLDEALAATAELVRAAGRWSASGHPLSGHALGGDPLGFATGPDQRCGSCAWRYGQPGQGRCRRSADLFLDGNGQRVDDDYPACAGWEPALDCQRCAACCREGFDSVSVGVRETVVWKHPALVVRASPSRFGIARQAGRCAALVEDALFACSIYQDRPRTCREVNPGDRRCLLARRRVGLTAHG
jgi:hypothetical protein